MKFFLKLMFIFLTYDNKIINLKQSKRKKVKVYLIYST